MMSTRHRVALALKQGAQIKDFRHEVYTNETTATYAFRDPQTARIFQTMLRMIFKSTRPSLIHNGRKP
jgi:hypothetical protein